MKKFNVQLKDNIFVAIGVPTDCENFKQKRKMHRIVPHIFLFILKDHFKGDSPKQDFIYYK